VFLLCFCKDQLESIGDEEMKSEKTAIQVLCVTAILLALACIFVPRPVVAEVTTKEADYLACTYPATTGGDGLYVADTRTGMIAFFMYDPGPKALVVQAIRPLGDAFVRR
jgi:hypothetical protein